MAEPPSLARQTGWCRSPAHEDLDALLGSIQDGVLVLDAGRRSVLAMNERLASWFGSEVRAAVLAGSPLDGVEEESRGPFLHLGDAEQGARPLRMRLRGEDGPVEVEARGEYSVNRDREGRWIYWFRPVTDDACLALEGEVVAQRRRTESAIRTSLQIYQVTEKIRAAPQLSNLLIGVRSEDELYERVGNFLTSDAIYCRFVRILMVDVHGRLRSVWCSDSHRDRRLGLPVGSTVSGALEAAGSGDLDDASRWEVLECRGERVGLLEIQLDPREEALLEDAPMFREWIDEVIRTLAEMLALFHENVRLYRQLEGRALYDPLTGLFNRHHLFSQLDREVHRARRESAELSVIFVDLDGFKEINDGHGHLVGDRLLSEMALLLVDAFRDTDYLCRFGGDEFVAILPSTAESDALQKAESLGREVRATEFEVKGLHDPVTLTLSIGVAGMGEGDEASDLIRRADEALYAAKRSGRDRAVPAAGSNSDDDGAVSENSGFEAEPAD